MWAVCNSVHILDASVPILFSWRVPETVPMGAGGCIEAHYVVQIRDVEGSWCEFGMQHGHRFMGHHYKIVRHHILSFHPTLKEHCMPNALIDDISTDVHPIDLVEHNTTVVRMVNRAASNIRVFHVANTVQINWIAA